MGAFAATSLPKSMSKPKVFLLMAAMAALLQMAGGQTISSIKNRESLLNSMEAVLNNTARPAMEVAGIDSPFHAAIFEEASVARETATEAPRPTPRREVPEILPDRTALSIIAGRFDPQGSLIMGDRGMLQLGGARTIAEGETFNAEIKGHTYEVRIEEVSSRGYRLRLGNATLEQTFLTTTGKAPQP